MKFHSNFQYHSYKTRLSNNTQIAMSTQSLIIITLDVISGLVTIIGNAIFFVTISYTPSLHTPSNVLLACLSLSDILVGVLCQPLFIAVILQPSQPCCMRLDQVYNFTFLVLAGTSFSLLVLITGDRFLAIFYPFKYIEFASCRKSTYIAIVVFTACLLYAAMDALFYKRAQILFILVETSLMILTLSFNVISYILIYRVIHQKRRTVRAVEKSDELSHRQTNRTDRVKTNTVAFILLAFIGCTTPYIANATQMLLYYTKQIKFMPHFMEWTDFLFLLNSAINPLIYFLRRSDFRQAAKRLLFRNSVNTDNMATISHGLRSNNINNATA